MLRGDQRLQHNVYVCLINIPFYKRRQEIEV